MRIIILMLATLVAFNSQSVKLKITNNSEPEVELNLVGSPTIEQSSGNIVLSTTSATYNIVNGSQFFELGFFPDDYEVVQNQKINVKAAVANAVNCVASTSPAGAMEWCKSSYQWINCTKQCNRIIFSTTCYIILKLRQSPTS